MNLTKEQAEKLHRAVDAARDVGLGQYVLDGAPSCVIGQLAAIEGVTLETMLGWVEMNVETLAETEPCFRGYPVNLLRELQQHWDRSDMGLEATQRLCHLYVRGWETPG